MTTAMNDDRQACTGRRRTRVQAAIRTSRRDGIPLTPAAVARAAGIDRTFLYRHRDMLDALHCAEREPTGPGPAGVPAVTRASLQADLANADARASRLTARVRQLDGRLSRHLGEQAWHASGPGPPTDVAELQSTITRLEQTNTELKRTLEECQGELDAARAAHRDLTRALNQRG
ncbi:hypothetical protein ACFW9N_19925 [Streptomyces sp. NPDC059496]|uniref:hypothetical protein n=1 Tax=Streptomyces sp. NPDC059496 TaxID=3346851 RepID=UPI0036AE20E7